MISRLLLLPSHPIQEIDLYRYIWDGEVSAAGVSPWEFSPAQVLAALATETIPTAEAPPPGGKSNLHVLMNLCASQAGDRAGLTPDPFCGIADGLSAH